MSHKDVYQKMTLHCHRIN